ncbi:hypothetical protein MtrunA17_Chr3g0096611 [Medicago truncatula]|uniref:MBD domain-containing protein n=1 Tax=Medicago truncatula TaxID=3880 RepID=A0A396IQW1_MEDTR|nr:hypothetical protein MtrunA17_Chr3g0096611 [Medicago truncatula]
MAANQNSNIETSVEKEDDMIHDVEQISCVFPYDNNDDDNTNFDVGDDKNDIPKHNNDKAIIIAPINEILSPPTTSTRKPKIPKGLSKEWIKNWEVKETSRRDGIKVDKTYYHKKEKFTLRSLKAVEEYEISGTLPQHKRKAEEMEIIIVDKKIKESFAKKQKEEDESMPICVEEFLADAHYNLLHWFEH